MTGIPYIGIIIDQQEVYTALRDCLILKILSICLFVTKYYLDLDSWLPCDSVINSFTFWHWTVVGPHRWSYNFVKDNSLWPPPWGAPLFSSYGFGTGEYIRPSITYKSQYKSTQDASFSPWLQHSTSETSIGTKWKKQNFK